MSVTAVRVFAKAPIRGRVKTRLTPVMGLHGCVRLARAQLARTLSVAAKSGVGPVTLCVAGGPWHPHIRALAGRHEAAVAAQRGGDLGSRMDRAAREALRRHDRVILVGTDCPGLSPEDLREADRLLSAGADVVLGPALDGGYYLAGLARRAPVMFRRIPWGGGDVLNRTLGRLRRAGFHVALLGPRGDLDRPRDLAGSPFLAGAGRLFQSG